MSLLDYLAHFVADNSGKVFSANSIVNYLKSGGSIAVANYQNKNMKDKIGSEKGMKISP